MGLLHTKFYFHKNKQLVIPSKVQQEQNQNQNNFTLQSIDCSLCLYVPYFKIQKTIFQKINTTKTIFKKSFQLNQQTYKQYQSSLASQKSLKSLTNNVFKIDTLCEKIMLFLKPTDIQILKKTSSFINLCALKWHLNLSIKNKNNQNNWLFINAYLEDVFKSKPKPYEYLYTGEQESQHSLDLDRLSHFFENSQDFSIQQQQNRLDRVLTQLSFKIQYFQGINSIGAIILHFQDEDTTYRILRYLLFKINNIQIDSQVYKAFLKEVQDLIFHEERQVMQILLKHDFTLQYFCMQWIMGLFSYELLNQFAMELFQWLCLCGLGILKFFMLSVFVELKSQIKMCCQQEQINDLLKNKIKQLINVKESKERIFAMTKQYFLKSLQKKIKE